VTAGARRAPGDAAHSSGSSIELIIPYPQGGGTDQRSRLLARHLAAELGEPVVPINRTGAIVGHTAIAQAQPDGKTLGMITGEIGMMHWHRDLTALTWRDYVPLAVPYVEAAAVIVRADARWTSLEQLLSALREHPLTGSGGPDFGVWKFAMVGLMNRAGIGASQLRWMPTLSGEEGVANVIAGHADIAPITMTDARAMIFAGQVRALATMEERRHPMFPEVPTVAEAIGIPWRVAHWRGLVGPAGMPEAARERIVAAARRIAADPVFDDECRRNGYSLHWRFDRDFADYMVQDDKQFGEVIALLEGTT
jgi:tripartite-type tricarboxylate transporter receptor subunit TctC